MGQPLFVVGDSPSVQRRLLSALPEGRPLPRRSRRLPEASVIVAGLRSPRDLEQLLEETHTLAPWTPVIDVMGTRLPKPTCLDPMGCAALEQPGELTRLLERACAAALWLARSGEAPGPRLPIESSFSVGRPDHLLVAHPLLFNAIGGADLRGADLAGSELSRARLEGLCLEGARLENAQGVFTNARAADLRGADLRGSLFVGCDFSGAWLEGAQLATAEFVACEFAGARLDARGLGGTYLVDCSGVRRAVIPRAGVAG